jgi:subfamily B ATP-binding cassette protein MsbA
MKAGALVSPGTLDAARRFVYLMRRYAMPFWPWFALVLALNLVVAGLNMAITALTATCLGILNGNTPKMLLERKVQAGGGTFDVSLSSIGSLVFQYTGIDGLKDGFELLMLLAAACCAMVVAREALNYAAKVAATWLRIQTARSIQSDLFKHFMSFSMAFFNRHRAGELMSRLTADTNGTVANLQNVVSSLLVAPIMVVFFSIITFKASPLLFGSILLSALLFFVLGEAIGRPLHQANRENLNLAASMRAFLTEAFVSVRVIKSFAAEKFEHRRLQEHQELEKKNTLWREALQQASPPAKNSVNQIIQLCIFGFAAYELLVRKSIQTDTAILFIFVCAQLVNPIRSMAESMIHVGSMLACSEKVFEYFQMRSEVKDGSKPVHRLQQGLVFDRVSFAYDGKPVLENISLELPKGKTTALVGPSGAGKSTLADLLLRFYDPPSGSIRLDGTDIREFKQADYRKLFGIVSQESLLFNTTLWDNIIYGRTDLSEADVARALETANLAEVVRELPDGLQTLAGDRGLRLSGGQRQRMAIARAVVGRPQILVLDEATSALDSQSEREVQKAIERVTENTTALIIAHRLSTILHAHNIVVMDRGRILDQGTHGELLQRCELYGNLCRLQFGSPPERAVPMAAAGLLI